MTQEEWIWARWKARTDLLYLCKILGYKDVCREVHGPILDLVQQFPLPDYKTCLELDSVRIGQQTHTEKHHYRPFVPLYDLKGWRFGSEAKRRRLLLYPRSFLKTTVNCIAHSIQIILNYPHIAIAFFQGNTDKAQKVLGEVKHHFEANPHFRQLFPDYCPPEKKRRDFGNLEEFSVPNKGFACQVTDSPWHREPTLRASSIERSETGMHFDWLKFSDIVDEKNTLTDDQTEKIKRAFYYNENLLVHSHGWIDVEGTRYHFADVYGAIIDQWEIEAKEGRPHEYDIVVRSVYERQGDDQKFTPDELLEPWKLDDQSRFISIWPSDREGRPKFPTEKLEAERIRDPWVFATQKLNSPAEGSAQAIFPIIKDSLPKWISRHDFSRNVSVAFYTTTVDLAETQSRKADFTVITTCAWSKEGKCYVVDIKRGRFLPDEAIDFVFQNHVQYRPTSIAIEQTGFSRGLASSIARKRDLSGIYPNFLPIQRDNKTSKAERIRNALQPWYKSGDLIFLQDLTCIEQLYKELQQFPAGAHDDILDTLADQFQGREWFGRLGEAVPQQSRADMLIKEGRGHELAWEQRQQGGNEVEDYWTRIGG